MEAQSIHRGQVDWRAIRASAYSSAAGATTTSDTYPAISEALVALGTNHSFLRPPMEYLLAQLDLPPGVAEAMFSPLPSAPEGELIAGNVAYLRVPGFSGPDPDAFAVQLGAVVLELDGLDTCGWVVDLRGNGGGNMWPMLQGLTPLLGEGVPGYFRLPTGERTPWPDESGSSDTYRLRLDNPPVAVLHGGETASSGEAMVVAFRGRAGARSFGQPTAGLSTGNESITLSDGAVMVLTTSAFEDRTGVVHGGVIQPDEVVPLEGAVASAVEWLVGQRSCGVR
jgi:C-terminal processing protease CtpA/Prc